MRHEALNPGTFNVVVDGQWGSCGKGLINTALADRFRPDILSSTNMANAGHTCIVEGETFVAKALPTSAFLMKHRPDYFPHIVIGPTAGFTVDQLISEIARCGCHRQLVIHPRAGVITNKHKREEESGDGSTIRIASTMQGCGAMLKDKISRREDFRNAWVEFHNSPSYEVDGFRHEQWVRFPHLQTKYGTDSLALILNKMLETGRTILHEGSQGFSLGISHGSHYPHCTSRECTATQMAADMGISPFRIGEVIMVIRPFPIRVGNVVNDGVQVGYSGDCYEGQQEVSWDYVAEYSGAPPETFKAERTTVTKRIRRVFTFSHEQLRQAAEINGATQIALNFANYIDWSCLGCTDFRLLPQKVMRWIAQIEETTNLPVTIVGTGPKNENVSFRF